MSDVKTQMRPKEVAELFINMCNQEREGSYPLNPAQVLMVEDAVDAIVMINNTVYPKSGIDGFDFNDIYLVEPLDKFIIPGWVSIDGSKSYKDWRSSDQLISNDYIHRDHSTEQRMLNLEKLSRFVKSSFVGYERHKEISVKEARYALDMRNGDNWDRLSYHGLVHYMGRAVYWKGTPVRVDYTVYEDEDLNFDDITAMKRFIAGFARFDDEDRRSRDGKSRNASSQDNGTERKTNPKK